VSEYIEQLIRMITCQSIFNPQLISFFISTFFFITNQAQRTIVHLQGNRTNDNTDNTCGANIRVSGKTFIVDMKKRYLNYYKQVSK
jgi:hypothetical protein